MPTRTRVTRDWLYSPFAAAEQSFSFLTRGPQPLALDCRGFDPRFGLPARNVPLPELRRWLDVHHTDIAARQAIWRALVARARSGAPAWLIAIVVLALPRLTVEAKALVDKPYTDAQTDVITAFMNLVRSGAAAEQSWLRR